MTVRFLALALSLALGLAAPCYAGGSKHAGKSVGYGDHYAGYHLRPPYYIPGVGWHYPPKGRVDRRLYYGFHFHGDHPPLIAVRVKRVRDCRCTK